MTPPSYLHLYLTGVRNTIDAAVLWHLAKCGVNGCQIKDLVADLRINYNTAHSITGRLWEQGLVANPKKDKRQGLPNRWIISRLGYRLITGQIAPPQS